MPRIAALFSGISTVIDSRAKFSVAGASGLKYNEICWPGVNASSIVKSSRPLNAVFVFKLN